MADFKTVSLADQVFEKLESDIITGVYARGELLTELKLVNQLGVSRTPIREALRRLEQERLIEETGKGSLVLGITVEDLMDIMEIRQRIEGLAAYYAAKNMTNTGLNQLREILHLQKFYFDKQDVEHACKMDDRFHDTIYKLCRRTVIHDTLLPLYKKTLRYRKLSVEDASRLEKSILEHQAILDAMATSDADLAASLIQNHIENAKENMIKRFDYHG